jgi:hypothetical protein
MFSMPDPSRIGQAFSVIDTVLCRAKSAYFRVRSAASFLPGFMKWNIFGQNPLKPRLSVEKTLV